MNNRNGILATAGVAIVMLVIGVAIGSVAFPITTTKTQTITSTLFPTVAEHQTAPSIITTSSNSIVSTYCTIADSGELFLTLRNSSSEVPLTSVPIQVYFLAPICPPNPRTTATVGQVMTNQSGIAFMEGEVGEYYFSLTYSGINYNVIASVGPKAATCVTLEIPSGNVNITNSPPMQNIC